MTTRHDDTDFHAWTQAQAAALQAKDWAALDVAHLAEEIADVGNALRFTIESHLERLLLHLLKWRDDPAQDPRRRWRLTIRHARREIAKRVGGSLQDYPAQYLAAAYRLAREDAADETGLPLTTFPEACPWAVAHGLAPDFWPEGQP